MSRIYTNTCQTRWRRTNSRIPLRRSCRWRGLVTLQFWSSYTGWISSRTRCSVIPVVRSTWNGLGYTRYSEPACKINELPHLDAVIISHDHYDHLDKASVKEIQTLFPKVRWILPKGIGDWFIKKVCRDSPEQVKQLTWWRSVWKHLRHGRRWGKLQFP